MSAASLPDFLVLMSEAIQPKNQKWKAISPAKVNLYLAVTGRRDDGFHELISLVSTLAWGDTLSLEILSSGEDKCLVSRPDCPNDGSNLAMRAIKAFRERIPELPPVKLMIEKRIPLGAGLGGGSSNASTCLKGLNALLGTPLSIEELIEIAANLGSDCPLFLSSGATWMRGRGEILEPASDTLKAYLQGAKVIVFQPPFSIETAWAYSKLAERGDYRPRDLVLADLEAWNEQVEQAIHGRAFNSFEAPLREKYIAYIALFQRLQTMGTRGMITGSGSACFVFDDGKVERTAICDVIKDAWGSGAVLAETILA